MQHGWKVTLLAYGGILRAFDFVKPAGFPSFVSATS